MKPIPYGKQNITDEDIQAVVDVLKSDFLTQGPRVKEFEERFAKYIGSKYAVAVANGTAALHLSALALGVKPGQKVITTPITFAASANCVRYAGGEVLFADIDPKTYLLDINKVEDILKKEKDVVGIIPVDFAGRAVNLEEYRIIADKYNCWILEDACHAPGGYFIDSKGIKQFCGNGAFAELAIFSFHPVKHIATGEGGMITTNKKDLYEKLLLLRTHGITKDVDNFKNTVEIAFGTDHKQQTGFPAWYYEMQELGFNYRLSDIHAALGIKQLKKIEQNLKRRNEIATHYNEAFKNLEIITPALADNIFHAYHLYIIQAKKRKKLYDYLRENNIFTQVHYIPLHLQPYYQQFGWKEGDLPNAEKYYQHCLSLPMFPALSEYEQSFVINKIDEYFDFHK